MTLADIWAATDEVSIRRQSIRWPKMVFAAINTSVRLLNVVLAGAVL